MIPQVSKEVVQVADQAAGRSVLYIDMAYTLATVRRKGHQNFFEARHSGGLFKRVWGVHPLADIAGSPAKEIEVIRFSPRQMQIEGVSSERNWPTLLAPLDLFLSQAKLVRRLARLIKVERIDLIVATDPGYGGLLGVILKRLTKRPLAIGVYANYDLAYRTFKTLIMPRLVRWFWLQTLLNEWVLRRADLVIGGNQDNLDWAISHGARVEAAAVVPNARNIQSCHLIEPDHRGDPTETFRRLGIPLGGRYLLMISRLIPVKFAEDGVKAMIHALAHDDTIIGIVAGEGRLGAELEARVEDAGLDERIVFIGHVDQEVLSQIIPHAVTVSPLTGMALVESGLGGSPAVAYDADWQSEFVKDGVNGFIVPMGDYRQLGDKALMLARDDALRRQMSKEMRRHARRLADPGKIAEIERAVFGPVLDRADAQRAHQ